VLSGRGLCDELITRPEESYQLWCVVVCDLENPKNEEAMIRVGSQRHSKKKKKKLILVTASFSYQYKRGRKKIVTHIHVLSCELFSLLDGII